MQRKRKKTKPQEPKFSGDAAQPKKILQLNEDAALSPQKASRLFGGPALKIIYCVLFMVSIANLGFAFMDTSSEWYTSLVKPALMPPTIALPIAWTALCALGAVSMSIINLQSAVRKKTLVLYALAGVAGVLWIYVFFCRHNLGGAVFLLIAITAAAALLYSDASRTSKTAAYLIIPCIIWLCYSLYLSYEIAFFNY